MSPELLTTKAREICYALVRVSYYIKRNELRNRLDNLAFQLLENTACATVDANDKAAFTQLLRNISALDTLVRMGHSLYEIEPVNATILVRELDSFNSAIRQFGNLEQALPNLDTFFTTNLSKNSDKLSNDFRIIKATEQLPMITPQPKMAKNEDNALAEAKSNEYGNGNENGNGNGCGNGNRNGNGNGMKNMAIRQTTILDKIRSGNGNGCRLKDLTAEFPYVSERTLRYDLQKLTEQGIVERMGNGGPASYYQLKQEAKIVNNEL